MKKEVSCKRLIMDRLALGIAEVAIAVFITWGIALSAIGMFASQDFKTSIAWAAGAWLFTGGAMLAIAVVGLLGLLFVEGIRDIRDSFERRR